MTADAMEKNFTLFTGLFLASAAWLFAGLRARYLPYFGLAAGVLSLMTLSTGHVPEAPASRRTWWLRDLFFWPGLFFLLYLGLQYWNAGRGIYYDVELGVWTCTGPARPGWPWAFNRQEAMEMIYWFFPAWALGMAVRAPAMTRQGAVRLLHWIVYLGSALAAFGIIQFLSGTTAMYWLLPLQDRFFASFGYSNHAAAYFVMVGSLAAGLLFHEIFRTGGTPDRGRILIRGSALTLCLTGANLSLSRAGIILAWSLAAFIAGYGILHGWRRLRPATRLYLAASMMAAITILYFLVAGFGRAAIRREFSFERPPLYQMIPALENLNLDLSVRPIMWKTGWDVFTANPIYGTGGWGYRYMAALHVSPENLDAMRNTLGWANVHNDFLQFLGEFGLIGFGLMALAFGALTAKCLYRTVRRGSIHALTCTGLLLVMVFSLIDLPFRCPAILWTWVTLAALLPKCAGLSQTGLNT